MTKVYCGCIVCKHNNEGVCKLKEIKLTHDSVATTYQGRQEFNNCSNKENSDAYKELQNKLNEFFNRRNNANNSK